MVMPIATVALSPQNIPCRWIWLVVDLPLWKMSSSVGMIIPNWMEKNHVPNHQPVMNNSPALTINNPYIPILDIYCY